MKIFPILIRPTAQQIIYTTDEDDYEIFIGDLFDNNEFKIGNHEESFIGLSQSIDGNKLMSYSIDGVIKLWDIPTKELIFTIKREDYEFDGLEQYYDYCDYYNYPDFYLKISPDASHFICYNDKIENGRFDIWDIESKSIKHTIELDYTMWEFKISSNNKSIAYLTDKNSIRVTNSSSNVIEIKFELFGERDGIRNFFFYNNNRILLIHSKYLIQEFDIKSGKEVKHHDFSTFGENSLFYSVSNVFDESKIVLIFSSEVKSELMIYNLEEQRILKKFTIPNNESEFWSTKQIFVSTKGDIILIYFDTDTIQIWVDNNKFDLNARKID
jgi:WD40 repeat protein